MSINRATVDRMFAPVAGESILTPKQFDALKTHTLPSGRRFDFQVVNGSAWLLPNRLYGVTITPEGDAI